jgi:hypothetical protein
MWVEPIMHSPLGQDVKCQSLTTGCDAVVKADKTVGENPGSAIDNREKGRMHKIKSLFIRSRVPVTMQIENIFKLSYSIIEGILEC